MPEGIETPFKIQREQEAQRLLSQLRHALDNLHEKSPVSDEKRLVRQNEILRRLPDDFWENYKARLIGKDYEDAIYDEKPIGLSGENRSGEPLLTPREIVKSDTVEALKRVGVGELFEYLVRGDTAICNKAETDLAQTLRQFMANPKRYELPSFLMLSYHFRNPDLAWVDDQGNIQGWVECKAGHLDPRSVKQLSESGLARSFSDALNYLSKISRKTLENCGLGIISRNKDRLRLSPNLSLTLAVPFGRTFDQDTAGVFSQEIPEAERPKIAAAIAHSYKIKESPFSKEELDCLNEFLIDKFLHETRIPVA